MAKDLMDAPLKVELHGQDIAPTKMTWDEISSCKNPMTKPQGSSPHEIQNDSCEVESDEKE